MIGSDAGSSKRPTPRFMAVGECMVEMAPLGEAPDAFRMGFAGDTFNTAWYARRLLPEAARVGYVSAVGDDDVSERMLRFMDAAGVETDHVARIAGRTVGLYLIALSDGERSFSYWRSASAARRLAHHLPDPSSIGASETVVHVSGITLAILPPADRERLVEWMGRARARGATVSFDPNVRPRLWEGADAIRDWVERGARAASTVLPSLDEEARDFGTQGAEAVADRYLGWGAGTVAVKNGAEPGLLATSDGRRERFACERVERVVDTTAAGDSFNAGFLAARMRGEDESGSIRHAVRLAARVVQHRGALVAPNAASPA